MIVGLTGGISCGKTTVTKIMKECGFVIITADDISHELTAKNNFILQQIKKIFGNNCINQDGSLKRDKIAKIIFKDKEKRELLNNIVHPQIIRTLENEIIEYKRRGLNIIIIEAALLFESGYDANVDIKLIVVANRKLQIERLMKRDNLKRNEAILRVNSQLPVEKKISRADFVIYNNGSQKELEYEVINALAFLKMRMERDFHRNTNLIYGF